MNQELENSWEINGIWHYDYKQFNLALLNKHIVLIMWVQTWTRNSWWSLEIIPTLIFDASSSIDDFWRHQACENILSTRK
jgi:hypothetical protein